MWIVKGKTVNGKDVEYKVPVGKDTDKAFVMALAFQDHGKAEPEDALTAETSVTWTSDNVVPIPTPLIISKRQNWGVDKRVTKGVWTRHSARAYRTLEAAEEALESAASEYPNDKFRIVVTTTVSEVVAISKTAHIDEITEEPEAPKEETTEAKGDAVTETPAPATPKRKPSTTKAA